MNKQEIENYNRLCAEFLGAIYSDSAEAWGFGNAKNIGSKMFRGVMDHNVIQAERFEKELKFHSDWNWIMEVLLQIQSLPLNEHTHTIWNLKFRKSKEEVVGAINQFLIWYEQNKTT